MKIMRKAQANMLEYALLTFFVMLIIFVIILFLTGFQIFQIDTEAQKLSLDRTLSLSKQFMISTYLTRSESVFDDAKMTASLGKCKEFENIFGGDWFLELRALDNNQQTECSGDNYPACNYWKLCGKSKRNISYVFPVNIYSKSENRINIGSLKVGIYT